MLKNLYLSATITTLSFFSANASIDRINAIKDNVEHIEQAQTDSMLELKATTTMANKAVQHFQNKLGDGYEPCKSHVMSVLDTIFQSDEFAMTLDAVTNLYLECVINQHMNFYDIIIDSTNYPLEEKIKTILEQTSPVLSDDSAQIFDVFYVTVAIVKSAELFCEKLDIKKNELLAELAALEATN
jgi:hypothetical protein